MPHAKNTKYIYTKAISFRKPFDGKFDCGRVRSPRVTVSYMEAATADTVILLTKKPTYSQIYLESGSQTPQEADGFPGLDG